MITYIWQNIECYFGLDPKAKSAFVHFNISQYDTMKNLISIKVSFVHAMCFALEIVFF